MLGPCWRHHVTKIQIEKEKLKPAVLVNLGGSASQSALLVLVFFFGGGDSVGCLLSFGWFRCTNTSRSAKAQV